MQSNAGTPLAVLKGWQDNRGCQIAAVRSWQRRLPPEWMLVDARASHSAPQLPFRCSNDAMHTFLLPEKPGDGFHCTVA